MASRWSVRRRYEPGSTPGLGECVRAVACERRESGVRVHHHVANLADTLDDPLPAEILDRGVAGAEEERGEGVDQDPVQLLGHRPVERAKPGLHVRHRDAQLGRRQGACQRRVGVPVDEDGVGSLRQDRLLDAGQHAARLLRMRSRADLEPVLGIAQFELVEEDLRELAVVVLARVEDDLVDLVSKCEGQGSRLDELWPVSDDGKDFHGGGEH